LTGESSSTEIDHSLREFLAELQSMTQFCTSDRGATRSAASGWSIAQHLEHTLLAIRLNRRAILAIERGRDDGPHPPTGPEWAQIRSSGEIPRGLAESPSIVLPSEAPCASELRRTLLKEIDSWASLSPRVSSWGILPGRIAHPSLGALTPWEWLQFARIHTAHHQAIIGEIWSEPGESR